MQSTAIVEHHLKRVWRLFFVGVMIIIENLAIGGSLDHRLRETSNRSRPMSQILLSHIHATFQSRVAS